MRADADTITIEDAPLATLATRLGSLELTHGERKALNAVFAAAGTVVGEDQREVTGFSDPADEGPEEPGGGLSRQGSLESFQWAVGMSAHAIVVVC